MLSDAIIKFLLFLLDVILFPVAPLFAWVPAPSTAIPSLPQLVTDMFTHSAGILWYLNLTPFLSVFTVMVSGMVAARLGLFAFDLIMSNIPVINGLWDRLVRLLLGR